MFFEAGLLPEAIPSVFRQHTPKRRETPFQPKHGRKIMRIVKRLSALDLPGSDDDRSLR
jgi:hypothetical protein